MIVNFKEFIPNKTLPRFNGQKRVWIKPANLKITTVEHNYLASYKIKLYKNRCRTYKIKLPITINIDEKFLVALAIYACEGRNPNKGVYTKSAANKGRDLSIVNSNSKIINLVLDEFESKLEIDRNQWAYRLVLYDWHNIEKEKSWWSKTLRIQKDRLKVTHISKSDPEKIGYSPHGNCIAELYSVIYACIIYNLCQSLLDGDLFKYFRGVK